METHQYPTLRTRFAFVLIILATLFAAGVSSVLYINFKNEVRSNLRHRLENITSLAGLQQNGDALSQVHSANDKYFEIIQQQNSKIKISDPDLRFVYTMREDQQGIFFVVDARISPDEPLISEFGDRYEKPSATLVENFSTMKSTIIEPDFYTDEFGTFLSGYTPIFASNGERVGVLGVDISANTILAHEREYLIRLITIFASALPLLIIAGIIFANYLAKPIIGLRDTANKISKGDFSFRITKIPKTHELAELANDFNRMTENLSGLVYGLEERVKERTAGFVKKTDQLRAASFIARQTAEAQDLYSILNIVVKLVTDQFGFYHTGIFLINDTGDEAILYAASSEGGQRMVEKGYSLSVGTQGLVGIVAAQKKPRIGIDGGADAVIFDNPDLPITRSELALPLIIHNKALGVLDIQSDKPEAFSTEDIDVLETLADQVAVAIENARLLAESKSAFMQLEALTTIRTHEAWDKKLQERERVFTYTPLGVHAEKSSRKEGNAVIIPINLRGQKIGTISIARKGEVKWSRLDEDLITEVAGQVGLAVDNIRLLEDATQLAKQEQIVGQLAARFSQWLDIDSLLQTAARELGQLSDVSEVSVFIGQLPEQTGQKRRVKRITG